MAAIATVDEVLKELSPFLRKDADRGRIKEIVASFCTKKRSVNAFVVFRADHRAEIAGYT